MINIEANDLNADWLKTLPEGKRYQAQIAAEGATPDTSDALLPSANDQTDTTAGDSDVAQGGEKMEMLAEKMVEQGIDPEKVKALWPDDDKAGRRVRQDKLGLIERIKKEWADLGTVINEFLKWGKYSDKEKDAKLISIDEFTTRVRQAFRKQFSTEEADGDLAKDVPWVSEVYTGFVVADDDGGKLYKVPYTQTQDGFDFVPREEWVTVERKVDFVPVDGGIAMEGAKAGSFVTIDGRVVFMGGPGQGGGAASGEAKLDANGLFKDEELGNIWNERHANKLGDRKRSLDVAEGEAVVAVGTQNLFDDETQSIPLGTRGVVSEIYTDPYVREIDVLWENGETTTVDIHYRDPRQEKPRGPGQLEFTSTALEENFWQHDPNVVANKAAGSFITTDGRVVFIGGPGAGGGSAQAISQAEAELELAKNALHNMGIPEEFYQDATTPAMAMAGGASALAQSGFSEEEAFNTVEGEYQMHLQNAGLRPKPEPKPQEPEKETIINLVSQAQLDAERLQQEIGIIDDFSKVGASFNAEKVMRHYGLPASTEPTLYGYYRGLYTLDEALAMLPETEGLAALLHPSLGKSLKTLDEHDLSDNRAFAFKTVDGDVWWFQWTSNSFVDRERETFTQKALEDYVARHRDEDVKGEFWYRHIPGTKFGTVKWQAMVGRFLAQAGPFDDTSIGKTFKSFFKEYPERHPTIAPEGWGTSHGYFYNHEDRKDNVYDWLEIKESTVLPSDAASNPWSPAPSIVRSIEMNEKEKQDLLAIGGQKFVDLVMDKGITMTKDLEDKGIAHKNYADFAVRITAVADGVTDEALKGELMAIAQEMNEYGAMEYDEAEEEAPVEEMVEGEAFAMASSEGKQTTAPTTEELGNAMGALVTMFRDEIKASKAETITEITAALKPLTDTVKELRLEDGEKIKREMEQTPAASLMQIVESAIGSKETEVKEDDPLLSQKPAETQPSAPGSSQFPPFIAAMVNNQQQ